MQRLLKQLIPTLTVGFVTFATLFATISAIRPPNGIPLERGWELIGLYGRTGAGRASVITTVGGRVVLCDVNAFTSGGECSREWAGKTVRVRQARLPTLVFSGLRLSDIWIGSDRVFHLSDDELRDRWRSGSLYWLYFGTLIAMFITASIHQYCFIDKGKK